MNETVFVALAICVAVVVIAAIIVLCVIIYHQMLLFNEVNKRLLLKSIDDQEKYEGSLQQLAQAEAELQRAADAIATPKGPLDDSDEEVHDLGIE